MIKRYSQFIKENDEFRDEDFGDEGFEDFGDQDLSDQGFEDFGDEDFGFEDFGDEDFGDEDFDFEEEEDFGDKGFEDFSDEEEAVDIYKNRLNELAEKLGTEVVDGEIHYNGKTIIFPSETEMYHIGKNKFKTSDEVVDFLERSVNKTQELTESRSYKNRFRI